MQTVYAYVFIHRLCVYIYLYTDHVCICIYKQTMCAYVIIHRPYMHMWLYIQTMYAYVFIRRLYMHVFIRRPCMHLCYAYHRCICFYTQIMYEYVFICRHTLLNDRAVLSEMWWEAISLCECHRMLALTPTQSRSLVIMTSGTIKRYS